MRWFILIVMVGAQACVSAQDEERPLTSVSNEVVKEVSALDAPAGTECEYSARYEVVRTRAFECAEWGPRPGCLDPTIPCPTVCTRGTHRHDGPETRKLLGRTLVACRDCTALQVSPSTDELVAHTP
ncbi:MAG: hypothetical protein ACYC8T_12050 [Myxococcaceae bacterium]